MVPHFTNGSWDEGLVNGVKAVRTLLVAAKQDMPGIAKQNKTTHKTEQAKEQEDEAPLSDVIFLFLLLAFLAWRYPKIFVQVLASLLNGRHTSGRRGGGSSGGSWGGRSSGDLPVAAEQEAAFKVE